ncbi:MAG: UbiD family decarboxylase [Chloroflexi bacterium]|nr:UbiD family decarboxylase [Chloroflexota bacterium]
MLREDRMYYRDLRDHIEALERNGRLVRVTREINKDLELMPLVRWQFRGLPEAQRKAFLFENVVDVKGRRYDIPVLVASHAASAEIYALGMQCECEPNPPFQDPKGLRHQGLREIHEDGQPRGSGGGLRLLRQESHSARALRHREGYANRLRRQ